MNLAHILYPVEVLGPGKRVGIWLCGCEHQCLGCSNPELWQPKAEHRIDAFGVSILVHQLAASHPVEGITITGGEPFLQAEELAGVIDSLRDITADILIYTGYTLAELNAMQRESVDHILARIAVLIDGRYVASRNNGAVLRGSDNQVVHILNPAYREAYEHVLQSKENRIQNFQTRDGIVSVGIHKEGFKAEFEQRLAKSGIIKEEAP